MSLSEFALRVFVHWLTMAVTFYWLMAITSPERGWRSLMKDALLWPVIAAQGFWEALVVNRDHRGGQE